MQARLTSGKAVFIFGGGPSAVINRSAEHLVLGLERAGVKSIGSPAFGLTGILDRHPPVVYDISSQNKELMRKIAAQSGAMSGTARRKLDKAGEEAARLLEMFRKNDVRYVYLIGGDDTARVCLALQKAAAASNYEIAIFHVAKTIDNDLHHDHTPGFGSAARFVLTASMGIKEDTRSTGGVHIVIPMGKDAGYLTAAAAAVGDLFFLPEMKFSSFNDFTANFMGAIQDEYTRLRGSLMVMVSEGIGFYDEKGIWKVLEAHIAEKNGSKLASDNFGGLNISRESQLGPFLVGLLKPKIPGGLVKATTFGYTQRSYADRSNIDVEDASLVGDWAVKYTLNGEMAGSVALRPFEERRGQPVELLPLDLVGSSKREVPHDWIVKPGYIDVEKVANYIHPLIGTPFPEMPVQLEEKYLDFKA